MEIQELFKKKNITNGINKGLKSITQGIKRKKTFSNGVNDM